jgi:hypothetical protein
MLRPGNPVDDHGQPRPAGAEAPGLPTAAERARTLVDGNADARPVIPGPPAGLPGGRYVPARRSRTRSRTSA